MQKRNKMKTIIFEKEINFENISRLISAIEEAKKEKVQIYFSSIGGVPHAGDIFLDFIKNSDCLVELIAFYQISSAAFDVFFNSKCKKRIMDFTSATVHLVTNDINYKENKDKTSIARSMYNEVILMNKESRKFYKKILTKKEYNRMQQGKDVQLDTNRLKEILQLLN